MSSQHIEFLNAYIEHRQQPIALMSPDTMPTQIKERQATLEACMRNNETSLFTRQNVDAQLEALSAPGQDLRRQLNLNNPEHRRKINIVSLAFSDEQQAWQNPTIPMEDKFQAMRVKVALRCNQPKEESSKWSRRLDILRDIAVQGAAGAAVGGIEGGLAGSAALGIGALPGAAAGAGLGFFANAIPAAATHAFNPAPDTGTSQGVLDCEIVSLLPEYFIAGNAPDELLTPESRQTVDRAYKIQLGQQVVSHLQQEFLCSPQEAERLNQPETLHQIGEMIAADNESTKELLQSILKQQGMTIKMQQQQQKERQALSILLSGVDKKLSNIDARMKAEQQAKAHAATVERAKQAALGFVDLGTKLNSPFLQKVGQVGGTLINLEQAMLSTAKSFSDLAQGGLSALAGAGGIPGLSTITSCFSFLAGPVGIATAVLGLFSLFRKNKSNDGLAKALQSISKQLVALHQEMRQSFQITWDFLNEIEQRNYERFNITLKAIDYVGTELSAHLDTVYRLQHATLEQLEAGIGRLENYVHHIADQPMRKAFEEVRLASSKSISKHLERYVAPIHNWLISTATLSVTAGHIDIPEIGHQAQTLWLMQLQGQLTQTLKEQGNLDNIPLGFYRSLFNSIYPPFVQDLERDSFMNPRDWLQVCRAYLELVTASLNTIAESEERIRKNYLSAFHKISSIAKTNFNFINRLTDKSYIYPLIENLIGRYQQTLMAIEQSLLSGVNQANLAIAHTYGNGFFALDKALDLSPSRSFDRNTHVTLDYAVEAIQHSMPAYLVPHLSPIDISSELITIFFETMLKEHASASQALLSLLNDPKSILAHNLGLVSVVLRCKNSLSVAGTFVGLSIDRVACSLLLKFKHGEERVLCSGTLIIPSCPLSFIPQTYNIKALASSLTEFTQTSFSESAASVFNCLPQESDFKLQRQAIGKGCKEHLENIKRCYLELISVIRFIDPHFTPTSFDGYGVTVIEQHVNQLERAPTAENLQALMTCISELSWQRELGANHYQSFNTVTELACYLQERAKTHPLSLMLREATNNMRFFCETAVRCFEETISIREIVVEQEHRLHTVSQQIQTLDLLNQKICDNQTVSLIAWNQLQETLISQTRVEDLITAGVLMSEDGEIMKNLVEEKQQRLDSLYKEANEINNQRQLLFMGSVKQENTPTTSLAVILSQRGFMPNPQVFPTTLTATSSATFER